jgi:hypothetical protein
MIAWSALLLFSSNAAVAQTCPPGSTQHEETVAATFGPQFAPWFNQTLQLPRFTPLPGQTLVRVDGTVTLTTLTSVQFENLDPLAGCSLTFELGFEAQVAGPAVPPVDMDVLRIGSARLGPADGVLDFQGPASASFLNMVGIDVQSFTIVDPGLLPAYSGPGTVTFNHSAQSSGDADTSCSNLSVSSSQSGAIQIELVYTYCQASAPPVCPSNVAVDLWPPNHQYVPLRLAQVSGVADPGNLPLSFQIIAITQDEPIDAHGGGDGHTVCDGAGIGSGIALIRAERRGGGNGRVYKLHYVVTNSAGLSCTGTLTVRVPHAQNGQVAVDDGQVHASNQGC